MSNGVPTDDNCELGTTFSKYSKKVNTQATMDTGQKVDYDPANGSYPAGTLPALSKDWGTKDENGMANGFDMKKALPGYSEGGGPKTVDF